MLIKYVAVAQLTNLWVIMAVGILMMFIYFMKTFHLVALGNRLQYDQAPEAKKQLGPLLMYEFIVKLIPFITTIIEISVDSTLLYTTFETAFLYLFKAKSGLVREKVGKNTYQLVHRYSKSFKTILSVLIMSIPTNLLMFYLNMKDIKGQNSSKLNSDTARSFDFTIIFMFYVYLVACFVVRALEGKVLARKNIHKDRSNEVISEIIAYYEVLEENNCTNQAMKEYLSELDAELFYSHINSFLVGFLDILKGCLFLSQKWLLIRKITNPNEFKYIMELSKMTEQIFTDFFAKLESLFTELVGIEKHKLNELLPANEVPGEINSEFLIQVKSTAKVSLCNFTIAPGEKIALVGPKGSGKTQLLKFIAGMVKIPGMRIFTKENEENIAQGINSVSSNGSVESTDLPDDVSVPDNSAQINSLPDSRLNKLSSLIPQHPVFIADTVSANLKIVEDQKTNCPIDLKQNAMIKELSLFERNLFFLKRALIQDRQILLVDEMDGLENEEKREITAKILSGKHSVVMAMKEEETEGFDKVVKIGEGEKIQMTEISRTDNTKVVQ